MATFVAAAMIGSAFAQGAGPRPGAGGGAGKAGKGQRGPGGPMGRRGGMMMNAEMMQKLNLTADQKAKIKVIAEKLGKDVRAAREKNSGDREAQMTAIRAIAKGTRESFMKVLTPAQRKQYDTLAKAEREKRRKEGGGRPGGPGRGRPGTPPPVN